MRGIFVLLLLLATGGWTAPVAVIAAPSTPADGAIFDITWSTSCETPPAEAVTALDYAAGLWGTWISSTVPISVTVCWTPTPSGGDALGTGMPTGYIGNFPGAPLVNTAYPIALANALSGSDLDPMRVDMTLQFKSDIAWSFITTTTHLPALTDGEDFVAVALHELAHGLGFIGNMYESSGVGFCGDGLWGPLYPCPTPYDRFVVDGTGVPLLDYYAANDRYALAARLTGDAHFGGPNAVAVYSDSLRLYTPAQWQWGSSLSHLDQTTFQGSPNRLMTPSYSGVTRHPGAATLGIFQDMGWLRADGVPNVVTSGPWIVGAGQVVTLTGDLVWSSYAGQPVTYTWTAAEHITVTHPGLAATDSVTFTWDTPGEKRITLTATDGAASASAVRATLVYSVGVSGLAQGDTNHAYTFDAVISPEISSFPITYTWEATDKASIVHADLYQTSDSSTFTWTMPGTKTITVTAAIAGAVTYDVHEINIEGLVLDKHIFLPLVLRQ
ncbi:MAG: hypothetical protein ACP5J4_00940 [Anaerolineae bacterium]